MSGCNCPTTAMDRRYLSDGEFWIYFFVVGGGGISGHISPRGYWIVILIKSPPNDNFLVVICGISSFVPWLLSKHLDYLERMFDYINKNL